MVSMLAFSLIILFSVNTLLQVFEIGVLQVFPGLFLRLHVAELNRHQLDLCLRILIVLFDGEF